MPRYIDADALKETIENAEYFDISQIDDAPTADVVERTKGKWIISKMPVTGAIEHRCSGCDTPYYMAFCFQMNYCPNCGAEMKGEQDDAVLDNRSGA